MSRNKKIGIALLALPLVLIVISLGGASITGFFINKMVAESSAAPTTIFRIIRFVLGAAGILGIIGIFTAIPAGIYFMAKHQDVAQPVVPAVPTPTSIKSKNKKLVWIIICLLLAFIIYKFIGSTEHKIGDDDFGRSSNIPLGKSYVIYSIVPTPQGQQVNVLMRPLSGSEDELLVYLKNVITEVTEKKGNKISIYFFDTEDTVEMGTVSTSFTDTNSSRYIGDHLVAIYNADVGGPTERFNIFMYPLSSSAQSQSIQFNPAQ